MLVLTPGFTAAQENVLPKDIVFVFDRSGSMAGDKIRQAREALMYCIEHLNEKDRSTVVDYGIERTAFGWDAYKRCFLGEIPAYECIRRMTQGTPWESRWPEIYQRTLTEYAEVLDQEVWELIHRLKAAYRQGLISNNSVEWGVQYTVRYGLRDLFDPLIFSATESLRTGRRLLKPEPEIFLHALGKISPSQAVFIDDSARNIQGTRAVGLNAVHFTDVSSLVRELRKLKIRI